MTMSTDVTRTAPTAGPGVEVVRTPVDTESTDSAPPGAAQEPAAFPEPAAVPERGALRAARLLTALALAVSAYIHAHLAWQLGLGGPLLDQGHLFAAHALLSAVLACALLTRDNRVWLVAVTLSVAGLGAIVASVYFPLPAVGPFPGIDEPAWLLSKAVAGLAEVTVVVLWLIRQIAPPQE